MNLRGERDYQPKSENREFKSMPRDDDPRVLKDMSDEDDNIVPQSTSYSQSKRQRRNRVNQNRIARGRASHDRSIHQFDTRPGHEHEQTRETNQRQTNNSEKPTATPESSASEIQIFFSATFARRNGHNCFECPSTLRNQPPK